MRRRGKSWKWGHDHEAYNGDINGMYDMDDMVYDITGILQY